MRRALSVIFAVLVPFSLTGCIVIPLGDLLRGPPLEEQVLKEGAGLFWKEKVALVDVSGVIQDHRGMGLLDSGENTVSEVKARLEWAASDPEVKALVLRISSPGGEVTACDVLYREVKQFRERQKIPVVACILDQGTSGAYYVAAAAEAIVAHPTAIVGSIGVLLQSVDASRLLEKLGISVTPVKSSEKKDLNSFFRPLSGEERAILQKLVDDMYERFVTVVDEGRSGLDRDRVLALADGRVLSGEESLRAGLVDQVGYLDDAVAEAARRAGVEDPTVVRYARSGASHANLYTQLGVPARPRAAELHLSWPLDETPGVRLYYLWCPGCPGGW